MAVALPGILVVALFALWAARDGGYPPTVWYPGALFVVVLLAVVVFAAGQLLRGAPRLALAAAAALAGFAAWSYLSILWAGSRADAWDGANRALLYAAVYALFALLPWGARTAAALLGAFSLSVAAIGAAAFWSAVASDTPQESFAGGRLTEPVGYVNADAALFVMAFWPAVFLAGRRETPLLLRGPLLAVAGLLLELALLPQSRGAFFAFPAVALLYLAVVPGRARSALALAPALVTAGLASRTLLDVYDVAETQAAGAALDDAARAILVSVAALLAVGWALAAVDRLLRLSERTARRASIGLGAAAGVAAVVAAVVALVQLGSPFPRVERAWNEFTNNQPVGEGGSRFAGGLGSNRYDFWRVAMGEFRDSPLLGIGADNFATDYVRKRESPEEPLYPHSLPVMVLSQTGVVGALLFGAFVVLSVAAFWHGRRHRSPFGRAVAATALVVFASFALHGSVDWLWEFPGLGAPALAWLGLAAGVERPAAPTASVRRGRSRRAVPAAAVSTLALVAACASLALPWLSARELDRAASIWRTQPGEAYGALDNARRLNPLSARADLVGGAIALRRGDYRGAEEAFTRALERDPDNWYAELELAVVAAHDGRRQDALDRLERAERLNPREETVDLVRRRVLAGEPVDPRAIDRIFLQRVEERTS